MSRNYITFYSFIFSLCVFSLCEKDKKKKFTANWGKKLFFPRGKSKIPNGAPGGIFQNIQLSTNWTRRFPDYPRYPNNSLSPLLYPQRYYPPTFSSRFFFFFPISPSISPDFFPSFLSLSIIELHKNPHSYCLADLIAISIYHFYSA